MNDFSDALIDVEQEGEVQELTVEQLTVWDTIKRRIEAREITMSFSKLKAFSNSPYEFVMYMIRRELKRDEGTAAMVFGSLVDCLILTPDELDTTFVVEPEGGVLNSVAGAQILLDFYGVEFAGKFAEMKEEVRRARERSGMRVVTSEVMQQAIRLRDRVYANDASGRLLHQMTSTQVESRFKAFGWEWVGKFDGEGDWFIADLKMMVSARPKKARWTILDMKYLWQGALYTLPRSGNKKFFNICVDRSMGVSVIQADQKILRGAWYEIEDMMQEFERCIYEGIDNPSIWFSSYDFFVKGGVYDFGKI